MFYKKIFNYLSMMLLLLCVMNFTNVMAQTATITGKVVDQTGDALPGVTVQVVGTNVGAITDVNGNYSINASANATLHFSFVGYVPQDVAVGEQRMINITLQEDVAQIEEIVVVGYGVMRKSDVTGAVLQVTEGQLKDRPVANAMEALQGKAAGVDITNDARPGELGSIRIRGERSITGSSNPLYVVDGIPIFGRNNVNSINTADIKSIEILKDASATAIYGSRGANGVIMITTNAGEEGRFTINYNGSLTFSKVMDSAERMDAGEWIDLARWARHYLTPTAFPRGDQPTQATDMNIFQGDPIEQANVMKGWAGGSWDPSKVTTTDWTKFVLRTGVTQNHTLSVSGGTSKVRTYASLGYMDDKGTSLGQRYKRYTLNLNTTAKPLDWFELGGRLNGSWSDQEYGLDTRESGGSNAGSNEISSAALRIFPTALPYYADGTRIEMPGGNNRVRTVVDEYKLSDNQRQMLNVMANVYAQVNLPVKGLSFRTEFGPSFRFRRNGVISYDGSSTRDGSAGNWLSLTNQRDFVWTVNNILSYNNTFGDHSINVALVQTASKTNEVGDYKQAMGDTYIPAKWNSFQPAWITNGILKSVSSELSEEQLASYIGRVNYGFRNRYLVTFAVRTDGSSLLAPGNKWATFPSASLAWRLDQEDFIRTIPIINQLKVRIGWGITGNPATVRYGTKGAVKEIYYPYGEDTILSYYTYNRIYQESSNPSPLELPNKDLTWEKTAQWNFGIDFSLLKNRIGGALDIYKSRTTDLVLSSSIPPQT